MIPRPRFHWACILLVALAMMPRASAQQGERKQPDEDAQRRPPKKPEPVFAFEISPQLLSDGLDLLVERRLAKDYGFDEYQHEQMRELLHEHVPRFLNEHREELQSLWAEWVEALASKEPPDPEVAAAWADRFLPIVEEGRGLFQQVSEEMREFLDDRQEVLLDGYLAVFETGTQALSNRLREFRAGGFNPEIHWPGYRDVRHRSPEEIKKIRQEMEDERLAAMSGAGSPSPPAVAEAAPPAEAKLAADTKVQPVRAKANEDKDEWARYVEAFIKRYQLNDEQKQKAYEFLRQQVERRNHYFLARGGEMERIEKMYKGAKSGKQLELAGSAYQKLMQPVDRMFERLKQKLETLPTRHQRRAAALAEEKEPTQRGPAPKRAADKRRP